MWGGIIQIEHYTTSAHPKQLHLGRGQDWVGWKQDPASASRIWLTPGLSVGFYGLILGRLSTRHGLVVIGKGAAFTQLEATMAPLLAWMR